MTLTDFLLARIAEDEETARDGAGWDPTGLVRSSGRWRRDGMSSVVDDHGQLVIYGDGPAPSDAAAEHIVRHDPAHVLAECEAKRRIVELHKAWPVLVERPPTMEAVDSGDPTRLAYRMSRQIQWQTEQEYRERFGHEPPTAPILRALALPYADHPDYREEWRP